MGFLDDLIEREIKLAKETKRNEFITESIAQSIKGVKGKPRIVYIFDDEEEALLSDPQFVNACEFKETEPIPEGCIGSYLGAKVLVIKRVK